MNALAQQALSIWLAGGWAMIALAVNAFVLFAVGVNLWLTIRSTGFRSVPERRWRRWLDNPKERKGKVGRLVEFISDAPNFEELSARFSALRASELAGFSRELKFMKRAVGTAPLLGLLGTVTGMLTTFGALAGGTGGQKTMDMIAGGISEALITTETGLLIALPGLFFQFHLARQHDRYESFLAHLETVSAQRMYRSAELKSRQLRAAIPGAIA